MNTNVCHLYRIPCIECYRNLHFAELPKEQMQICRCLIFATNAKWVTINDTIPILKWTIALKNGTYILNFDPILRHFLKIFFNFAFFLNQFENERLRNGNLKSSYLNQGMVIWNRGTFIPNHEMFIWNSGIVIPQFWITFPQFQITVPQFQINVPRIN